MGALLLCGYLFFDGLTSTTQERMFGKAKSSDEPFSSSSPVLDQMVNSSKAFDDRGLMVDARSGSICLRLRFPFVARQ